MKKDEQILRIKELISEDTLYGNLVDNELLNEGDGTKKVVKTASELVTTFLKLSAKELEDVNIKSMVKSIDVALNSFNNKVTKENITDYLNGGNNNNVYDEIGNILKTNFKGTKKGAGFAADHYLTDEIVTEIDTLVNNLKNLDLHNYKSQFEKLPQSTQDILDTIPNIRSQYDKVRPLFRVTQDFIMKSVFWYSKAMIEPFKVGKNLKIAYDLLKSKDGKKLKNLLAAVGSTAGGRKSMIAYLGTAIAKNIIRGYICPEYVKTKLGDPEIDKIKDKVTEKIKEEDDVNINEQEEEGQEESISSWQKGAFLDGFIFFLQVLSPKALLDPLQAISRLAELIGVDKLKGLGLVGEETLFTCPTTEENKEMLENLNKHLTPEEQALLLEKVEEVKNGVKTHVKNTLQKGADVIGVVLEKEGINQDDLINNKDLYDALRAKGLIPTDSTKNGN